MFYYHAHYHFYYLKTNTTKREIEKEKSSASTFLQMGTTGMGQAEARSLEPGTPPIPLTAVTAAQVLGPLPAVSLVHEAGDCTGSGIFRTSNWSSVTSSGRPKQQPDCALMSASTPYKHTLMSLKSLFMLHTIPWFILSSLWIWTVEFLPVAWDGAFLDKSLPKSQVLS